MTPKQIVTGIAAYGLVFSLGWQRVFDATLAFGIVPRAAIAVAIVAPLAGDCPRPGLTSSSRRAMHEP